jgi:hypothetical protein
MMNRKYSILHLPILSFFSKRLYRDVGRNWKGANMTYLFLLLAICWIPPTLSMRKDLIRSLDSTQVELLNQLPDIRIKNGMVKVEQTEPYYIKSKGKTVAIIDTTGSMNYIDDASVMALLTETKLIVRRGPKQFNTLDLSQVTDFHINKQIVSHWIEMTRSSLAPLSYGILLLLSYIFSVLFMLLAAIAGLILSALMHSSLKFTGLLRIAAAAITPSVILIAASIAIGVRIPGVIYAAVTLIYLLIGIIACSKPAEEEDIPKLKLTALIEEDARRKYESNAA